MDTNHHINLNEYKIASVLHAFTVVQEEKAHCDSFHTDGVFDIHAQI